MLYRNTIRDRGDAAVEPGIAIRSAGGESYLSLAIRPLHHPENNMTSGSTVYEIAFIFNLMLNSGQPHDGIWAGKREALHVGWTPGRAVPIGSLELIVGTQALQ